MTISFFKYHGAGNDFIIIDERNVSSLSQNPDKEKIIARLCHRRFGIGADGLMLLQESNDADFEMIYFNADGKEGTMCGNGGRCLVAFAHHQGLIGKECHFLAVDGFHKASIIRTDGNGMEVSLQMNDVKTIQPVYDGFSLDTGSPHYVIFTTNIESLDVVETGKKLRHDPVFGKQGINVNFVEIRNNTLHIRTYERGVEDETLACGTGITAAAIVAHHARLKIPAQEYNIMAMGGNLKVSFAFSPSTGYNNIFLQGPAVKVFEGKTDL
ncbi:MAG: diaminopimelate epimerase [Bacteroidota bacterium]